MTSIGLNLISSQRTLVIADVAVNIGAMQR